MRTTLYWLALGAAGMLGACTDTPTGAHGAAGGSNTPATGNTIATLTCTAVVAQRTVTCAPASVSGAANHDVIIGGQGQYIRMADANVAYDGSSVFSFDATVQNLIPQPLATADGVTGDAAGVKVFFASGPTVTGGTGSISVANADGLGSFTGSNQPYFAYTGAALGADGILSKNETSTAKNWQLDVAPTVTTFTFTVYVDAVVQHPQGYVNLSADTTVYMPADSAYVLPTQTHGFTASVLTLTGRPVSSGGTVTWQTSNSNVATVDGSGNVTAVAPGHATIMAMSDTLVSNAEVRVCPNMSVVGASYTAVASDTGNVCLGGITSDAEFVAVPYIAATSGSVSLNFLGSGVQGVSGPPNPDVIPTGRQQLLGSAKAATPSASYSDASGVMFGMPTNAHTTLMQQLRRGLPSTASVQRGSTVFAADHRMAMESGRRGAPGAPSRTIVPNFVPIVGDSVAIDVAPGCSDAHDIRYGLVKTVSQHAIIVADTANPANGNGFTPAQFDSIGAEFDSVAYQVDAANFGAPTDEDNNQHIVIFYSRAVNELHTSGTNTLIYGYFNPKDMFRSAEDCASSNEGELLYAAVPDPTHSIGSNGPTVAMARDSTVPALTHNLEHLINAWRRTYVSAAPLEEPWLDEGLADEARELAFYRLSAGLTPRTNIDVTDLTSGPAATQRVLAFGRYVQALFDNMGAWMLAPEATGAIGHAPLVDLTGTGSLAVRGVTWDFLRYASDRLNGTDADFWSSLVNSTLTGTANLQNAIGGADPFAWARDFSAAVYVDDNSLNVGTQYTTPSWNFRSILPQIGGYAISIHPLTNNVATPLTLTYGGASYIRFGVPGNTFARFGASTTSFLPSSFMMTIIRTK